MSFEHGGESSISKLTNLVLKDTKNPFGLNPVNNKKLQKLPMLTYPLSKVETEQWGVCLLAQHEVNETAARYLFRGMTSSLIVDNGHIVPCAYVEKVKRDYLKTREDSIEAGFAQAEAWGNQMKIIYESLHSQSQEGIEASIHLQIIIIIIILITMM
jgi:hypothetical protein